MNNAEKVQNLSGKRRGKFFMPCSFLSNVLSYAASQGRDVAGKRNFKGCNSISRFVCHEPGRTFHHLTNISQPNYFVTLKFENGFAE